MTVPRRLRPSSDERQLTINKTAGVLSARGGVPSARPVAQVNNGVTPAPVVASGGAAIIASGAYPTSTFASFGQISFDASAMEDDHGGIATHIGDDGAGSLTLLTVGWYQASCHASCSSGTTGDMHGLTINVNNGDHSPPNAYGRELKQSGVNMLLYAATIPFFNDTAGNTLQAFVQDVTAGGGLSSGLGSKMHVVKLSD